MHEEVLLGHGGAPSLICNQVRQTAQPHTPLSPPSRLPFLSPLLSPSLSSISPPQPHQRQPPSSVFVSSTSEIAHFVRTLISQLSPS